MSSAATADAKKCICNDESFLESVICFHCSTAFDRPFRSSSERQAQCPSSADSVVRVSEGVTHTFTGPHSDRKGCTMGSPAPSLCPTCVASGLILEHIPGPNDLYACWGIPLTWRVKKHS